MEWINNLIFGSGIPHTIFILALVIAIGRLCGKIKLAGVSIGVTWILFIGIIVSHFNMRIEPQTLEFIKEFGLILFIYSIGLQVGPGFFSAFKKGGIKLNMFAMLTIILGVITTLIVSYVSGTDLTTMVGIMSGAVTNTPGLGAAQQAFSDTMGVGNPSISMGYAIAYPMGVIGVILSMILIKLIFRVNTDKENEAVQLQRNLDPHNTISSSVRLRNPIVSGMRISDVKDLINRPFVISRVMRANEEVVLADAQTVINEGDAVYIVAAQEDMPAVAAFFGEKVDIDDVKWKQMSADLVSRRLILTKPDMNGKHLGELKLRSTYGVNVTRVNRAGVDLVASPGLQLQMGDKLTVVGSETAVASVSQLVGNSLKRLREPNLIPLFVGILLGVVLGMIPFRFGSIPQPVKLGLAGGPLIVSILMSRFGPHYHFVTYTTLSANLMLREIGISLFLAAVGLGSGEGFVETIVSGGYMWIGYGVIITMVPILIMAVIARKWGKLDYFSLMGVMAGSMTNPLALSFTTQSTSSDIPAVGYATVYPLTMFVRVIAAQMLILVAVG